MVEEDRKLVITIEFYKSNKSWLDLKAKKDERTRIALERLKSAVKEKISEIEKAIKVVESKISSGELSESEIGHRKEYLSLLRSKLSYYEEVLS